MVLIISNFWKKCLKRALEANVQKRSPFFLEHPVTIKVSKNTTKSGFTINKCQKSIIASIDFDVKKRDGIILFDFRGKLNVRVLTI